MLEPETQMNIKEIRQLIKLMVDNDLTEMDIESGSTKVALKRGLGGAPVVVVEPASQAAGLPAEHVGKAKATKTPDEDLIEIKSPMVGTFYSAASPEGDPFISTGDLITSDTVACIVEAMKVMNEIKADCSGTIVEVCASNAQPVEFGQVLFRVKP